METKEQAVIRLLNEYMDDNGFITLKHKSQSNPKELQFDSENPHLFTGEGSILLKLIDGVSFRYRRMVERGITNTKKDYALWERQPGDTTRDDSHSLSLDEHLGLCFTSIVLEMGIPQELCDYGSKHNWAFIEENPGTDPYEDIKKYGKRIRQPKDRFFMKVCAGIIPKWYEILDFGLSAVLTCRKPHDVTSGKVMKWFAFQALSMAGYDNWFVNLCKKYYNYKCTKMYGTEFYIEDLIAIYFQDKEHPFHVLCKELSL